MFRFLFALCLVLSAPARAETTRHQFVFQGEKRSYFVHTPETTQAGPFPVVLMLHGGGGSARQMLNKQGSGMNALADKQNFIVVYPEALGRVWDLGEGAISDAKRGPRADDVGYIAAVLAQVGTTHAVDLDRVFAAGMSQGGQMAFALACRLPGRLRAIATVAMSLPDFLADDCEGMPATPVALIHGTGDPTVPYDGGPIRIGARDRGSVIGVPATLAHLRLRNGCSDRSVSLPIGKVQMLEWQGCTAPVLHFRVIDGGHNWPPLGGTLRPERLAGERNEDIDASAEIWQFFSDL